MMLVRVGKKGGKSVVSEGVGWNGVGAQAKGMFAFKHGA